MTLAMLLLLRTDTIVIESDDDLARTISGRGRNTFESTKGRFPGEGWLVARPANAGTRWHASKCCELRSTCS